MSMSMPRCLFCGAEMKPVHSTNSRKWECTDPECPVYEGHFSRVGGKEFIWEYKFCAMTHPEWKRFHSENREVFRMIQHPILVGPRERFNPPTVFLEREED